jgi:hypothetical protein
MTIATHLEITATHCRCRPPDTASIVEVVELVAQAIAYCRQQQCPRLLVDVSRLTHLAPPTMVDRFLIVEDWAREAQGMVVVAVVAPEKLIDPDRFGVKLAAHSGMKGNIFASEREATAWLLAEASSALPAGTREPGNHR